MLNYLAKLFVTCCALLTTGAARAAEISVEDFGGSLAIISIRGEITSDDPETFRQISIQHPLAVVELDSDGGELIPAIEIGKIIRIAGYATLVGHSAACASSCALIWLAGSMRGLSDGGQVGFHASYRDNNGRLEESGVANALIGNYLTLLNYPEKTIIFATRASPHEILWLTQANKASSGIAFDYLDANKTEIAPPSPPPIQTVTPRPLTIQPPAIYTAPPPRAPDNRQDTNLSRPPRPLTAPADWVSWDDFPYKALGVSYDNLSPDMTLSVGFSVDVDSSGQVLVCRVTASSGLSALDDATCRAVSQRAVFIPGTDSSGNAAASRYTSTVHWETRRKQKCP